MCDSMVDDSICLICGGSTYQGETISCETCLHWFHFQCVGVGHEDECVVSEDVPFYCPSCDVVHRNNKHFSHTYKKKSASSSKSKKKHEKLPQYSKPKKKQKIKLKISLKTSADKSASAESKAIIDLPESNLSPDSDSSIEQPLIIDEIAPRIVKVGRRRPSQRQGSNSEFKPEETLGFELQMENLEALIKDVPGKTFADFVSGSKSPCSALSYSNLDHSDTSTVIPEVITEDDCSIVFKKDAPRNLTVRQRFKLEGIDSEDNLLSLDFGGKRKSETKENLAEKALKAQKRRNQESEKKEKIKKKTMDTLLKKKDAKIANFNKVTKPNNDNVPKISYVQNSSSTSLTFPSCSWEYPLKSQSGLEPPSPVSCCVCSTQKKYNCSKTGQPLCSLECYKINLLNSKIKL